MVDTYLGLEVKDWVTCVAVLVGPIIAIQVQKVVEKLKDKQERRQRIFKTLMATRAERVSREHVQALNMIYIEFYGSKFFRLKWQSENEKSVTDAWKIYNAHLNDETYKSIDAWFKKGDELFTELLYNMSQSMGYDFDKVQLQSDTYKPTAHVDLENAQLAVLNGWAKILNNEQALKMEVTNFPQS